MTIFQPPPTYADPVIVDEATRKGQFNPIWLKWFLDLSQYINVNGGGAQIQHSALGGLQGGAANEYFHLTSAKYALINSTGSPTSGGIAYGTGSSFNFSSAGTAGQILTSGGAGAPTWTTASGGTVTSVTASTPLASSGGTTPNITITQSSGSVNGYLSSTDWTTFNSKQPAGSYLTAVSASAPLTGNGTSGSPLSIPAATSLINGYLTSTDWTTFNNKQPAGTYVNSVSGTTGRITSTGGVTPVIDLASGIATAGTTGSATLIPVVTIDTYGRVTGITTAANPQGTVTSVAALTLGTTGTDLSSTVATGTTTPVITLQVPTASATNRGALSSADWTTFNNKQPAGTYVTSISVASSNGLAGTSSGGATPALTLSTSVTGILKGNGTAISAAVANTDYVPLSSPITKTADWTVTNTDTWYINNKTGSTATVTFPAASLWPGRSLTFKNMQAQSVVSASSNVVPIDSVTAGTAILLPVIGNWATLVSDGTNWVTMQAAPNNILLLE